MGVTDNQNQAAGILGYAFAMGAEADKEKLVARQHQDTQALARGILEIANAAKIKLGQDVHGIAHGYRVTWSSKDSSTKSQSPIIAEILQERKRQDQIWGAQDHDDLVWMLILAREVGEVAKDVNASHHFHEELVHVAAVCMAWLECIGRRKNKGA